MGEELSKPQQKNQMTINIVIEPVLNEWVCTVGCRRVVFDNLDRILDHMRAYYRDSELVEKSFVGSAINRTFDGPQVPQTAQGILGRDVERAMTAIGASESQPRTMAR